jgi:hypothetical protein
MLVRIRRLNAEPIDAVPISRIDASWEARNDGWAVGKPKSSPDLVSSREVGSREEAASRRREQPQKPVPGQVDSKIGVMCVIYVHNCPPQSPQTSTLRSAWVVYGCWMGRAIEVLSALTLTNRP